MKNLFDRAKLGSAKGDMVLIGQSERVVVVRASELDKPNLISS